MFAYTKLMQAMTAAGVVSANDPYFNLVSLLLNTTSTNGAQNNTFIDSSSNGYSITRSPASGPNAPTQGTFTPFSQTGWSSNFNTSTTYLTVTDTANFRFGSGNFTIEAWVYRNAAGAIQTIASKGASTPTGWVFQINAADKLVFIDTSTSITGATSLAANTWYYVAVVRAGTGAGQTTLYVNGASDNTGTSATTFNQTTNMLIGADRSTTNFANGYISNLRLSNTNRTISSTPTTALTADANTIFLSLGFNRFQYTDSTAAYTNMAVTGTPSVQAFSPFLPTAAYSTSVVGGSAYLDGTGDYLTIANAAPLQFDAGNFTIQCWVYRAVAGVAHTIAAKGTSTTGWVFSINASNQLNWTDTSTSNATTATIPAGSWTHVAAVRSGSTINLYINGVSQLNFANSTTYNQTSALTMFAGRTQANSFNGYIAGFEYVKGTALTITVPTAPPTTANSPSLLLNFTNAGIYDAAAKNDLETVADAQVSITQAKFGTTSIAFDGTGDYLLFPDSPNIQLGTGDFTIEGFIFLDIAGVAYGIISKGTATTGWSVNITSGNKLQFSYTATQLTGATSLAATTWYYFAAVRSGSAAGNLKLYLGTSGSTTLDATSAGAVTDNFNQTSSMYVGASRTGTTILDGYIDEIRITKGVARTVTTVPTAAFFAQ